MIKIGWPPGCYGSYVMQCIFAYSNLGNGKIKIGADGDSHAFRDSNKASLHFSNTHDWSFDLDVWINPTPGHELDYLSNHMVKQEDNNVIQTFQQSFPNFKESLSNWTDNDNSPWILREYSSFWINNQQYLDAYRVRPNASFDVNDLFNTDKDIFPSLINRLGLTVTTDSATMKVNQQQWIAKQRYHNLQHRCNAWVQDIVQDRNTPTPCHTIFDEAYVQHCLREQGYEIRCNGLNDFPKTSTELRELLYDQS